MLVIEFGIGRTELCDLLPLGHVQWEPMSLLDRFETLKILSDFKQKSFRSNA